MFFSIERLETYFGSSLSFFWKCGVFLDEKNNALSSFLSSFQVNYQVHLAVTLAVSK